MFRARASRAGRRKTAPRTSIAFCASVQSNDRSATLAQSFVVGPHGSLLVTCSTKTVVLQFGSQRTCRDGSGGGVAATVAASGVRRRRGAAAPNLAGLPCLDGHALHAVHRVLPVNAVHGHHHRAATAATAAAAAQRAIQRDGAVLWARVTSPSHACQRQVFAVRRHRLHRRAFLSGTGALVIGLATAEQWAVAAAAPSAV